MTPRRFRRLNRRIPGTDYYEYDDITAGLPCPVCGQASLLSRQYGRYFHLNGSDNDHCWVTLNDRDDIRHDIA